MRPLAFHSGNRSNRDASSHTPCLQFSLQQYFQPYKTPMADSSALTGSKPREKKKQITYTTITELQYTDDNVR